MKLLKTVTTTSSGLAILIVAIISLNIISSKLAFRADLTQDKVYSLSEGTKTIVNKLDKDVNIKLFFSRSIKELPIPIKTYATRVEEVLQEYKSVSGGKINIEVIDPKPDTDDEEWAMKYGVNGVRLPKGDQMFFGVVLLVGSQEIVIPYLDPRREEFLEYDLSEAIVGTMRKDRVKIGIMSSLPVMGSGNPQFGQEGDDTWAFVNDLRRNFSVEKVETSAADIASDIKVLIILHPKDLGQSTLYAIDQYVLNGGRLIVAVDPVSRTDLQVNGAAMQATGQMPKVNSELGNLFNAWDLQFDAANMVGDPTYATQINAGGTQTAYPFFMSLTEANLSRTSVITSNLKMMLIAEGGALTHKSGATSRFEPLITLSKDSGVIAGAMAAYMMPSDLARDLKSDGKEKTVAGMVSGKFPTAFPSGKPAAEGQSQAGSSRPHKATSDNETSIVVITDVDLFSDANSVDKFRFGPQVMVRARNDNLNFLVNAADFLGGSEDLIAIRSKGRIARPFDRVTEIQKNAQQRWQSEEEQLTNQLNDLQKKLNDMQAQRTDGNRYVLTSEQQSEITQFRDEERKVKQKRREVRKNLREDIEALGRRVVAANMLFVPLAAAGLGVAMFLRRSRKYRKDRHGVSK